MKTELRFVYISFVSVYTHIPFPLIPRFVRTNELTNNSNELHTQTFARLQMQIMHEQRFLSIVCCTFATYQHLAFAKSFHINTVIFNAFSFIRNSILRTPYFNVFFSRCSLVLHSTFFFSSMDVVQTPFISALNISLLKLIKNYD